MAQDTDKTPPRLSRIILKVAPLTRLDVDATLQGGLEYYGRPTTSVQAEFGYGTPAMQIGGIGPIPWTANTYVAGKQVWRLRVEGRTYIRIPGIHLRGQLPNGGTYVAVEGLYKRVDVAELDTVRSETEHRFVRAPVSRQVVAVHGKVGLQTRLSPKTHSFLGRFLVDLYVGVGVRYIRVIENGPETAMLFQNRALYDRFQNSLYQPGQAYWRPGLTLGFKVGFAL